MIEPVVLQNDVWQVGILPETGASIAFGRVQHGGEWVDVMRPTALADYGNSSECASFLMMPWCNRIKNGQLRFGGEVFQLQTTPDDGTARHGDVRKRHWTVDSVSATHIRLSMDSRSFDDNNFPFSYTAEAEYRLEGADFVWTLALKSADSRPMPGGFGHHPYFVRQDGMQLQVPCQQQFNLVNNMAVAAAVPVTPALDFRQMRPVDDAELDHVLTGRIVDEPARIRYPVTGITLAMYSDPIFDHILVYTPPDNPSLAVEPMTNVSDGFNLYEQAIPGSGVFVLESGEERRGTVRLRLEA
ncbi:MAG: aldose epimerase [Anaerolineae bacterium]|nr:aldose epimerase [Anaerolineae bacterium]